MLKSENYNKSDIRFNFLSDEEYKKYKEDKFFQYVSPLKCKDIKEEEYYKQASYLYIDGLRTATTASSWLALHVMLGVPLGMRAKRNFLWCYGNHSLWFGILFTYGVTASASLLLFLKGIGKISRALEIMKNSY